jgi:hypothetical protein
VNVCIVWPESGWRVWLEVGFARQACCGHALELVILRELDAATDGCIKSSANGYAAAFKRVPGALILAPCDTLSIENTADAVIADGCSLGYLDPATAIVAALHESSPHCMLQAVPSGAAAMSDEKSRAFVFVLGVIDDHEAAVGAVLDAAQRKGLQTAR